MNKRLKLISIFLSAALVCALTIAFLHSKSGSKPQPAELIATQADRVAAPQRKPPPPAPTTQQQSTAARRIRLATVRTEGAPEKSTPSTNPSNIPAKSAPKALILPGVSNTDRVAYIPNAADRVKIEPPLELRRVAEERDFMPDSANPITIASDFECASPLEVKKISPTHFSVKIVTDSKVKNWFMFRVDGAAGKTVRIDIEDANWGKWNSLNPVYSNVESIDDLASFESKPASDKLVEAYNGAKLSDTSGQAWKYISDVWNEGKSFCFVQRFEDDQVFVAMRCPYTVKYNELYLASLANRIGVRVIEVGKSKEGRPLQLVQIGEDAKKNPCIVMYAREHPSEHDTSWAVQGAIEWLSGNSSEAIALRKQITLIAIPLLDPDGASKGVYERITQKFVYDGKEGPESRAYAAFFKNWVLSGNRLDLTLNLHNVESGEGAHLFCPATEVGSERKLLAASFQSLIIHEFARHGFLPGTKLADSRTTWFRLSGYLALMYGPLAMPYEINSQHRERHLTLRELQDMGSVFINTSAMYLAGPQSESLASSISDARERHSGRMALYGSVFAEHGISNALQIEWVSWQRNIERTREFEATHP
ncbi:MAG: hypothetical protein H7144_06980 [Burkholderiales bacterium]|nr:hypothetical protein [Phycisphaerae bacterium]